MKWSEMTTFRKVAFVVWILLGIAIVTLTVLEIIGVMESIDILDDIVDCIFWLTAGIAYWKKGSAFPFLCFFMSGLQLICVFL